MQPNRDMNERVVQFKDWTRGSRIAALIHSDGPGSRRLHYVLTLRCRVRLRVVGMPDSIHVYYGARSNAELLFPLIGAMRELCPPPFRSGAGLFDEGDYETS